MTFTRALSASALAGGIALAGLVSASLGTASAAPGQACGQPGTPACQPNPSPQNNDWQRRGIDAGRQDHQPFMYQGQRVEPLRAGNGDGWGFWFLGRWIRL
ncbi:hypothetical protein [Mycolicibacterium iranicum]|uniref:Uncharacterized protein n=1 Tax=Mycolicibacterium iranicum TaxID=912594 RepID=A0A1X1WUI5_MYCIR|nr:hypothetical protein [Mycolicibacterium iranicum]MCZ0730861.1 hypothetical protein [Mycolicibacterium iranicum]ORV90203.1 hypothetical protein AWC12_07655 [Mycolicibacterium iranicum]